MGRQELLEVKLKIDDKVVEETLSRMGIPDVKAKKLYQSCHLYSRYGITYLAHFKQLFKFTLSKNGHPAFGNMSLEDIERRNSIAYCLYKWNMVDLDLRLIEPHNIRIFVLPHIERPDWQLIQKINVNNLFNLD